MTGRYDGFMNVLNGVGTKKDPMEQYRYRGGTILSDQTLSDMYMDNGIVQAIVDLPAEEAVKNWFRLSDVEDDIMQYLDDLNAEDAFASALKWSRLYGGAGVFLLINDGGDVSAPVNMNAIQEVEGMVVFDKTEIWEEIIYQNAYDRNFGKTELYRITPRLGTPFCCHESRLLIFKGAALPNRYRILNNNWGKSVIQGVWGEVLKYDRVTTGAVQAVERVSQMYLRIPGMTEQLATQEGEENLIHRLDALDMSRNIINAMAIDGSEEVGILNLTLAGIHEVYDRVCQSLSASTRIPITKLFGRSAGGLQSTGESDLENWYSMVKSIQRRDLRPQIEKLMKYIWLSQKGPSRGIEPEKWTVDFNALWMPSEKEQAETDEKLANAVEKLITSQALDPSEARDYLEQKGFPIDSSIDPLRVPEEE